MSEYLTGAALYRAFADMLEGGREVQMLQGSPYKRAETEWKKADVIHPAYSYYRFKPEPKKTVTVYTKSGPMDLPEPMREVPENGTCCWVPGEDQAAYRLIFSRVDHGGRLNAGDCFHTEADAKAWTDFLAKQRRGEL